MLEGGTSAEQFSEYFSAPQLLSSQPPFHPPAGEPIARYPGVLGEAREAKLGPLVDRIVNASIYVIGVVYIYEIGRDLYRAYLLKR